MQVQMYSLIKLPIEMRSEFCLKGDPYLQDSEDPELVNNANEARAMLAGLGVFFYRDEEHSNGIILAPRRPEKFPAYTPIEHCSGFLAYRFQIDLDYDAEGSDEMENVTVAKWKKPSKEYVEKHGDDYAWLTWNEEVFIREFDSGRLVLS